jgi:hypothetical protein
VRRGAQYPSPAVDPLPFARRRHTWAMLCPAHHAATPTFVEASSGSSRGSKPLVPSGRASVELEPRCKAGSGPVPGPTRLHGAFEGTSSVPALSWSAASPHAHPGAHTLPRRINDGPLGSSPPSCGETRRLLGSGERLCGNRETHFFHCSLSAGRREFQTTSRRVGGARLARSPRAARTTCSPFRRPPAVSFQRAVLGSALRLATHAARGSCREREPAGPCLRKGSPRPTMGQTAQGCTCFT